MRHFIPAYMTGEAAAPVRRGPRSVELVNLPGQPVQGYRQLPTLIAGKVADDGERAILHPVEQPGEAVRRYSHSSVFFPRAAGEPSMMRKMEEMVIIMAR